MPTLIQRRLVSSGGKVRMSVAITITVVFVCLIAMGITSYREVEYHGNSAWLSSRQAELRNLGAKILDYADEHDGILPPTREAFINENIIQPDEWSVRDDARGIEITRELRPVPDISYPGRAIIIIERYRPPVHNIEGQVLQLDGTAIAVRDLGKATKEDDDLRATHERGNKGQ